MSDDSLASGRQWPDPIVRSIPGDLSYLHGSGKPGDPLLVEGRAEPYPDAEAIERAMKASPTTGPSIHARFAHGRAANNLGAVHICTGRLQDALDALARSENTFVDILNDRQFAGLYDWPREGLAMARYNTAVLLLRAGDSSAHRENAWMSHERAVGVLEVIKRRDEKWEFLASALDALPFAPN